MNRKRTWLGAALLLALMGATGFLLLREQPVARLAAVLGQVKPLYVLAGLGLMLLFIGCEALCSRLILSRLGHRAPYRRCLGYSFTGFYFSSITPSSTGGQPAQIYYMSRDGIPAAHGTLNMMLIAVCYQVVVLLYALGVVLFRFDLLANLGGGLALLLLFGGAVNLALTGGDAVPHVPAGRGKSAHRLGAEPAGAPAPGPESSRCGGKAGASDAGVPPGRRLR